MGPDDEEMLAVESQMSANPDACNYHNECPSSPIAG
jgi:hypothetical protein